MPTPTLNRSQAMSEHDLDALIALRSKYGSVALLGNLCDYEHDQAHQGHPDDCKLYAVRGSVIDEAGSSDGAYDQIVDCEVPMVIVYNLYRALMADGPWLSNATGRCRLDLSIGDTSMRDDLPL